jgi:hypothetical protein
MEFLNCIFDRGFWGGGGERTTCDDGNCLVVTLVLKKSVAFENVPPTLGTSYGMLQFTVCNVP